MIVGYVGKPGECKTYSLVAWLQREMRRRLGLSQFAVDGARRLYKLSDLLHPAAKGAAVALDEVARILPARDWNAEDEVESLVFETHRHYGLDIRYSVQSPAQASVALRRLTTRWIYCYRVGLDPSRLIEAGIRPAWWQKPIAIRYCEYEADDAGDPDMKTERVYYRFFYSWFAEAYDTTERLVTDGLHLKIQDRLEGAEFRLLQDPWRVVNGKAEGPSGFLYLARDDKAQQERERQLLGEGDAPRKRRSS